MEAVRYSDAVVAEAAESAAFREFAELLRALCAALLGPLIVSGSNPYMVDDMLYVLWYQVTSWRIDLKACGFEVVDEVLPVCRGLCQEIFVGGSTYIGREFFLRSDIGGIFIRPD